MSVKIIPRFREKPKKRRSVRKKTDEQYKNDLLSANPNVVVVEEYVDAKTPIYHKCLIHDYYWRVSPTNALSGKGCPLCRGDKTRKRDIWSNDFYLLKLSSVNPCIVPLEKYVNANYSIWHWFIDCGHINKARPYSILKYGNCLKCSDNRRGMSYRKSHEQFIKELMNINPNVEVLTKYKMALEKISCKCKICGHQWDVIPHSLLKGTGCPICCLSRGERRISLFLNQYNIKFVPQYSIENLIGVGGGLLSYDFYLLDYNLLIEYQGEQHERPAFGEEQYRIRQEHDRRKREYAKQHNIKLLEIWYYDYDRIEEILKENLNLESVETVIEA